MPSTILKSEVVIEAAKAALSDINSLAEKEAEQEAQKAIDQYLHRCELQNPNNPIKKRFDVLFKLNMIKFFEHYWKGVYWFNFDNPEFDRWMLEHKCGGWRSGPSVQSFRAAYDDIRFKHKELIMLDEDEAKYLLHDPEYPNICGLKKLIRAKYAAIEKEISDAFGNVMGDVLLTKRELNMIRKYL